MGFWLYPISSRARYYFEYRDQRVLASYESFRDFVFSRRIPDDEWVVRNNFEKVRPGDHLFIYTGDQDRGIVAFALVVDKIRNKHSVKLRLDRRKTKRLLSDPVPAQLVRPLIPPPRTALVNLDRAMSRLQKLLPWSSDYQTRSSAVLSELKLRPVMVTTANVKGGARKQWLRHDSILGPVRNYLKAKHFRIGTRSFGQLRVDLAALRGSDLVIVEGKIIRAGAGRQQAREGLGQLLEYSWLFTRARLARFQKPKLWLAFSSSPHPNVKAFLANQAIIVSWPSRRGLAFAEAPRLTSH